MSKPVTKLSVRKVLTSSGELYDVIIEHLSLSQENMKLLTLSYKKQLEAAGNQCYVQLPNQPVVDIPTHKQRWN
jgi:hypothetical protein